MIQLLFLTVFAEAAVALLLTVKIRPLNEMVMKGMDRTKAGKGAAMLKILACALSVIFVSSIAGILKIQSRWAKLGTLTPMDQVFWQTRLLEASLIGFVLLLASALDRLHIRRLELASLKKIVSTCREECELLKEEQQKRKEREENYKCEIKKLNGELYRLKDQMQKLKSESEEIEKRAVSAEAHVSALQRQCEELLLEYDRLFEDNQILQTQALSFRG